eukprot:754086-Hanusia_phi.AAC.10
MPWGHVALAVVDVRAVPSRAVGGVALTAPAEHVVTCRHPARVKLSHRHGLPLLHLSRHVALALVHVVSYTRHTNRPSQPIFPATSPAKYSSLQAHAARVPDCRADSSPLILDCRIANGGLIVCVQAQSREYLVAGPPVTSFGTTGFIRRDYRRARRCEAQRSRCMQALLRIVDDIASVGRAGALSLHKGPYVVGQLQVCPGKFSCMNELLPQQIPTLLESMPQEWYEDREIVRQDTLVGITQDPFQKRVQIELVKDWQQEATTTLSFLSSPSLHPFLPPPGAVPARHHGTPWALSIGKPYITVLVNPATVVNQAHLRQQCDASDVQKIVVPRGCDWRTRQRPSCHAPGIPSGPSLLRQRTVTPEPRSTAARGNDQVADRAPTVQDFQALKIDHIRIIS